MKYIKYILILLAFLIASQALAFSGTTAVRYGNRGQAVADVQLELQRLNFLPTTAKIDGVFGRVTLSAVEAYQQAHNLTPDGVVGQLTLAMLREGNGPIVQPQPYPYPAPTPYPQNSNNVPPVITLNSQTSIAQFDASGNYIDPGYTAYDKEDGNITARVTYTDAHTPCSSTVVRTYMVTDSSGATTRVSRTYSYPYTTDCNVMTSQPTITLYGANPDNAPQFGNSGYVDPGYMATDQKDGNITSKVTYTDQYDPSTYCSNTMIRTYTVTNSSGVSATATRRYTPPFMRECAAPPVYNQGVVH